MQQGILRAKLSDGPYGGFYFFAGAWLIDGATEHD
jgi:hypothetical protein